MVFDVFLTAFCKTPEGDEDGAGAEYRSGRDFLGRIVSNMTESIMRVLLRSTAKLVYACRMDLQMPTIT
jgi:hypothetical protein